MTWRAISAPRPSFLVDDIRGSHHSGVVGRWIGLFKVGQCGLTLSKPVLIESTHGFIRWYHNMINASNFCFQYNLRHHIKVH
jgi:hypothetical protein